MTAVDTAALVKALTDQGVPEELAKTTAEATAATVGKTGVNELPDQIKAYVLAGVQGLDKVAGTGAVVSIAAAHA